MCAYLYVLYKKKIGMMEYKYCYGDISYHTPKMDSSNLNIFSELSSLGERQLLVPYEKFDRRTASRARLVLPFYDFLFLLMQ